MEESRLPSTSSTSGELIGLYSPHRIPYYRGLCDMFCATQRLRPSTKSLSPLHWTIINLGHPYMSMVYCDVRDYSMSHDRRHISPARAYSKPRGGYGAASHPQNYCEPSMCHLWMIRCYYLTVGPAPLSNDQSRRSWSRPYVVTCGMLGGGGGAQARIKFQRTKSCQVIWKA